MVKLKFSQLSRTEAQNTWQQGGICTLPSSLALYRELIDTLNGHILVSKLHRNLDYPQEEDDIQGACHHSFCPLPWVVGINLNLGVLCHVHLRPAQGPADSGQAGRCDLQRERGWPAHRQDHRGLQGAVHHHLARPRRTGGRRRQVLHPARELRGRDQADHGPLGHRFTEVSPHGRVTELFFSQVQ